MWTKHLTLILILILTGIGLVSAWNFVSSKPSSKTSSTKEGFTEPSTDEDIDYFVAVSNALKKVQKIEPSAKEVRRIVSEMRSKQVKIKDAEHFVKTNGGRTPIKENMEIESDEKESDETDKDADMHKTQPRETPIRNPPKNIKVSKDKPELKYKESFEVKQESTSIGAAVADKLTNELNEIADRIDELVEQISKLKSVVPSSSSILPPQPHPHPPASTTEGFAQFHSWSVM
jgi:predicted transcriptional regulator